MDYTLRELECFLAVAEELSFTRAARRLHLAQPPLSRHIRILEEKTGALLFDRTPQGAALTPSGAVFYEETRGVLPQLMRAAEAVKRTARGETSRLRLGFVSAVLGPDLVETFRRFREAHPEVQVMLHDMPPAEQWQNLAQGSLDGGFVGLMPLDKDRPANLQFVPWRAEALVAIVPSGHPLAKGRIPRRIQGRAGGARVALKELATESFVAVASEAAPAFSAFVRGLCQQAGFRPRIVLESLRAQAVAVMVAAGSGVALLPESLAVLMGEAVAVVPLKEAPVITHVFAHASGGRLSGAMAQFIASFRIAGQ